MKYTSLLLSVVCIAALALCVPVTASAAEKKTDKAADEASASPAAGESKAKAPRPIPFHGTVASVDQSAKTFTIAGKEKSRVFQVTDKTTVTKAGAAATMSDIQANEQISGSYWKKDDGTLEAKTVKVGGSGEKKAKKAKKSDDAAASADSSPKASPSPKK